MRIGFTFYPPGDVGTGSEGLEETGFPAHVGTARAFAGRQARWLDLLTGDLMFHMRSKPLASPPSGLSLP
jgi:hypothetical protein